jgi:hypothetical protein
MFSIGAAPRAVPRGGNRQKTMTLDGGEFIRRFLIHVLPDGFHRIRLLWLPRQLSSHPETRTLPRAAQDGASRTGRSSR